jgi:hypothetical protein
VGKIRREMMKPRPRYTFPILITCLLWSTSVSADDKKPHYVKVVEGKKEKDKEKKQGWKKKVDVGASVNFSQTSNVVGATDGIATALGAQIKGAFDYLKGPHEWLSAIDIVDTFTYTTTLGELVKTTDELKLKSAYLYHFQRLPWLGPYGEIKMNTAIFPSRDVRSELYTYQDSGTDPPDVQRTGSASFRLTTSFSPLTLQETLGAFARPVEEETIKFEARLGFAGRQTFVSEDQWAVDKADDEQKIVNLKKLESFYQAGPALGLFLDGALAEKKILYFARFEMMVPAVNSTLEEDERGLGELINYSFEAGISVKLVSWAAFSYTFKALREPQLVDEWQIQNNALLTFSYSLVD